MLLDGLKIIKKEKNLINKRKQLKELLKIVIEELEIASGSIFEFYNFISLDIDFSEKTINNIIDIILDLIYTTQINNIEKYNNMLSKIRENEDLDINLDNQELNKIEQKLHLI